MQYLPDKIDEEEQVNPADRRFARTTVMPNILRAFSSRSTRSKSRWRSWTGDTGDEEDGTQMVDAAVQNPVLPKQKSKVLEGPA